ncbi:glypican-4-like [Actinia tenebrosa]|uniref:Glypican-4-like n=1 Tax=Actinia tenebrosa TaxID=6105 RepID=A0A6P8GYG0_ACTTE|nr:glypican-4-like [Actinia tenebrosa]
MATYIALLGCFLVCFLAYVDGLTPSCTSVRTKYIAKGLLQSDVPAKAVSDSSLKVCSASSESCCSKRMEDSFAGLAKSEFKVALIAKTDNLKSIFAINGKVFDVFFQKLIKNSERDLNTMFLKTYGNFYKDHAKVFVDLFLSLTQYYQGKNLDLTQVMNNFFANLMKQMFQLMNSKYKFENSYLDCVTQHMDDLKPFGDEKQKLTVQVKRAFVAARAFVQGLNVGSSVLKQLQEISATNECEKEITKLSFCSWCQGQTDLKPCPTFCTDTYKTCFSNLNGVNAAWNSYVTALLDLSGKFEGPFSIESVINPLGVKISFAIMNFQEKHLEVAKKIFTGCGTPTTLAKTKRSSDDSDFFIDEPGKIRREVKQHDPSSATPTLSTMNLGKITKKFKEQIKPAKEFWQNLPSNICTAPKSSSDSANCWNGTAVGKYTSPGDSENNIDSSLSSSRDKVEQQVAVLKAMTHRLTAALSGEDVNVVGGDTDGSGDGSGSASGESGDGNDITSPPTVFPTTEDNSIDDNMLGGGASNDGGNTLGKRNMDSNAQTLNAMNALLFIMLAFVYVNLRWS